MVVHPPSTSQRQMTDAAAGRRRDHAGPAAGARSASRISRTCRTTFARPSRLPRAAGAGRRRRAPSASEGPSASPAPAAVRPASLRSTADQPAGARWARRSGGLFTSVDFAVVQIILLALMAVVGMTLEQLPDFAFRSAGDYDDGDGR